MSQVATQYAVLDTRTDKPRYQPRALVPSLQGNPDVVLVHPSWGHVVHVAKVLSAASGTLTRHTTPLWTLPIRNAKGGDKQHSQATAREMDGAPRIGPTGGKWPLDTRRPTRQELKEQAARRKGVLG